MNRPPVLVPGERSQRVAEVLKRQVTNPSWLATVSAYATVNVFRELPELIYQHAVGRLIHAGEIAAPLGGRRPPHHLTVEAIRRGVLPASRFHKALEA